MLRQFQNFSVCHSNTWAKKTAGDAAETFAYYVGSPGLNQINLIIYTTKFEIFLLDLFLKK